MINAKARQYLRFLVDGIYHFEVLILRIDNQPGMRKKGEYNTFSSSGFSELTESFYDFLMSIVYAIKGADSDHRIFKLFELREVIVYFQGN